MRTHVMIGKGLLVRIKDVRTINLYAEDENRKDCIKVELDDTTWIIRANLEESRRILFDIFYKDESLVVLNKVKELVFCNRIGRRSQLENELRELL